jgi:hypothetical protein
MTWDKTNIRYYGDVALCTAVNSIVYQDKDWNVRKEVEGINDLIFGILTSLKDEKVRGWCYTVANYQSFWTTMQMKLIEFYELSQPVVKKNFDEHGKETAKGLIPIILDVIKRKM